MKTQKIKDIYGDFTFISRKKSFQVSIIMSAYNTSPEYLKASITSVLEQSFEDFEFIIINDGANEETSSIINEYFKRDERISLVIQKNMGLTKSLNRAIALSNGKYIARQDSDDLWVDDKLEKQLRMFDKYKDVVLIGTQCEILDEDFHVVSQNYEHRKERLSIYDTTDIRKAIIKYNPFCHSSIVIKKSTLENIGSYNDSYVYTQDYELWVRVLKEYKAMIVPECLTKKIFHKNSITGSSKRRVQRKLAMKAKVKAISYFGAPFMYKLEVFIRLIGIYVIPEKFIYLFKRGK